jgi:hypothetical protein
VVPIGRPILNTRLYVLDQPMQPVPIGVAGELYIGGAQVGRGYWNRPGLTAERFIPDPFVPGGRLYKSGDLARWRADGQLECLGRIDFQVKIRGFRVELGEIETVLGQHPAVKEAVVWTWTEAGHRRLVAYVVSHQSPVAGDHASLIAELREFLRAKLPEYMLPSAFVLLEALPLNANGKVERKALPAPDRAIAAHQAAASEYVAPRTPQEAVLAAVWTEVLHLERVGVHDDFFDLGGDSILSLQIIARARQAGLHLTPRQIFETPTVAGLASAAAPVEAATAEGGGEEGAGGFDDFGWSDDDMRDILGEIDKLA